MAENSFIDTHNCNSYSIANEIKGSEYLAVSILPRKIRYDFQTFITKRPLSKPIDLNPQILDIS
ncbi:hypothetical protein ZMO02_06570 [Zymomonas mobilis subsp. pomaceae]|nr:hypothetical protein ZMO02_06570 [Zymomonas mobilis subsp. pomaceae]